MSLYCSRCWVFRESWFFEGKVKVFGSGSGIVVSEGFGFGEEGVDVFDCRKIEGGYFREACIEDDDVVVV